MKKLFTILVDCPDEKGLIYKITSVLYQNELNIIKNREYVDLNVNRFFMRRWKASLMNASWKRN
jgi:formyltetrahydrofolate deformylase